MNVNLSPDLEQLVSERIASGEYSSADEVMRVALARLAEDDLEAAHTEALLQEAEDSGDYIEWNEAERKSIQREAMEMFEQRKKSAK